MNWKRVIDELPVIPDNKWGVQVLIAQFDPCYDEVSSKANNGYDVRAVSYSYAHSKDRVKRDPNFKELTSGGTFETVDQHDPITHWMYFPEPPKYDPEVLNPIFQWYHDHSEPQTPLKQI